MGLGSRLQEVRPTIPARAGGAWGAKPPQLSALFSKHTGIGIHYRLFKGSTLGTGTGSLATALLFFCIYIVRFHIYSISDICTQT